LRYILELTNIIALIISEEHLESLIGIKDWSKICLKKIVVFDKI